MLSFRGSVENICRPILGKIVSEQFSQWDNGKSFTFISNYPNENGSVSGVILDGNAPLPKASSNPVLQLNQNSISLEIGDIVLIEPSGVCTILYQRNSFSNSLLLTERCNCRCIMCPQPPKNDTEDLVGLSLHIIELMDPDTETLGITGGEPTLMWEGLLEVLSACQKYIPSASIQLLSNARVLKQYEKAEELSNKGGANLFVGVSLYGDNDTLHDEIVGCKGAYWDTIEGIYNLERAGVLVEIRIVISNLNYLRLPQWAEFIYRSIPFARHVVFMAMEPMGLALQNIEKVWIDPLDYRCQLVEAVKILHRRNMQVSIYNHQLCTLPENLWSFSRRAISEWKTVYMAECNDCKIKEDCGGFFHSAQIHKSRGIKAVNGRIELHKPIGLAS